MASEIEKEQASYVTCHLNNFFFSRQMVFLGGDKAACLRMLQCSQLASAENSFLVKKKSTSSI